MMLRKSRQRKGLMSLFMDSKTHQWHIRLPLQFTKNILQKQIIESKRSLIERTQVIVHIFQKKLMFLQLRLCGWEERSLDLLKNCEWMWLYIVEIEAEREWSPNLELGFILLKREAYVLSVAPTVSCFVFGPLFSLWHSFGWFIYFIFLV